jgi:hypothetical protein
MLAGQDPKTIIESNGLLDDPEKALNERMLNAEVDQHLGREWTNPNICVKGFGADLSTAEGVACDERPTRWASRVHVTPGR